MLCGSTLGTRGRPNIIQQIINGFEEGVHSTFVKSADTTKLGGAANTRGDRQA